MLKNINDQINAGTNPIEINLSNLSPTQHLSSNHVSVKQNSEEWLNLRKNKITGSRIGNLLGMFGKTKFEIYWNIVHKGLSENDVIDTSKILF